MNKLTREEVIKEVEKLTKEQKALINKMWYEEKKTYAVIADAIKGTYTIDYWKVIEEYLLFRNKRYK